jgi:general secretion pathway protein E
MLGKHPLYNDLDYILNLLVSANLLSISNLAELERRAVVAQRKGIDLVQWLSGEKLKKPDSDELLEEADIIKAIAEDRGWRFLRLSPLDLDMNVVTKTLPASFAKKRLVLPVEWHGDTLEVACYYPEDRELKDDIKRACKTDIIMSAATSSDIKAVINDFFDFKKSIAAAQDSIYNPVAVDLANLEQYVKLASSDHADSEKHINAAVDHLFQYALEQRASDIHIEPTENNCIVRARIDGMLTEKFIFDA